MARPRSALAHNKVLHAAVELFSDRGIEATSMDAIAEASGVSKATIYKHWPDKDSLCLEVMGYVHGLDEERPEFDSGDFRADLIAQLQYQPGADRQAMRDKLTPQMIAYAARNAALGTAWRAQVMEPARVAITDLLKRGENSGVLRAGIDPEVGIALLLGPLIFRHVFSAKAGRKGPKDMEVQVADAFLAAFQQKRR